MRQHESTMDIDDAREWLDELAENLIKSDYTTASDPFAHRKLEALQIILARHERLEAGLAKLDNLSDQLGNVIAPLL